MRLGVWTFAPVIEARIRYDDNIFREETDRDGSLIVTASPSATLASDWRRHSVKVEAAGEIGVFTASPEDNYFDGALRFEGVLDATRAARLRFRAHLERDHEARGGDDTPLGLEEPVQVSIFGGSLTGQYAPGRLRIQPTLRWGRRDFQDADLIGGGVSDQDDRDRTEAGAEILLGWRWTRRTELTASLSAFVEDFDTELDRGGFDRDSEGFRALIGAQFGRDGIWEGFAGLGLAHRTYDDPALEGFLGPVAEASVIWRPTRRWEVTGALSRRIEATTVAPASGADVAAVGVSARWSATRLIDVTAETGFERRDFRGAGRRDETFTLGAVAEWRVTRGATLRAGVRRIRERSNAAGEDQTTNVISVGATHKF